MKNLFKIDIKPNRIFGLDVLRAFAIVFVVFSHGQVFFPNVTNPWFRIFIFDGVSIFFVLSGFLIGGILIKIIESQTFNFKALKDFWVRRWFRTLPNYFLVLLLLAGLNLAFNDGFSFSVIKNHFIFCQNLLFDNNWFFSESWSLSVEEWFYLIIPLLLFISISLFKISNKKSVLYAAILILVGVTAVRYYRFVNLPDVYKTSLGLAFRKPVITRLDSLMYGVIGAYIAFYAQTYWVKYKKQLLFLGIAGLLTLKVLKLSQIFGAGLYLSVFSFSLTSVFTLFLLPYLSTLKNGKGFFFKALTYISLISYSMYILHLSLIRGWVIDNINWENVFANNNTLITITKNVIYWGLTISISILNYKYFELPTTKLRNYFSKKE